jgi:hypothetical protein
MHEIFQLKSILIICRSDLLILKTIKQSVEMRNSVCHSATIYANALMHAGTTADTFLRENLVIQLCLYIYNKSIFTFNCVSHKFKKIVIFSGILWF